MVWVYKNVSYRFMRLVSWIFSLKSATRDMLGAILSTQRITRHMEIALSGVHADMYPISNHSSTRIDGRYCIILSIEFILDRLTDFAVHHTMDCYIGFRMRGPTSVFTAIRMAMDHIENESLGRYLILTDCMSSIRAMESRRISLHTHLFLSQIVGNWHEVAVK
jgi:hypothetical protein